MIFSSLLSEVELSDLEQVAAAVEEEEEEEAWTVFVFVVSIDVVVQQVQEVGPLMVGAVVAVDQVDNLLLLEYDHETYQVLVFVFRVEIMIELY